MKVLISCAAMSLVLTLGYLLIYSPLNQEKIISTPMKQELVDVTGNQEPIHQEDEAHQNENELDEHYHAISLEELNLDFMLEQFLKAIKDDPIIALDYFMVDPYIAYVYRNDVSSEEAIALFLQSIKPIQDAEKISFSSTVKSLNQHKVIIQYTLQDVKQEIRFDVIKQTDAHTGQGYWSIATEVQSFLDQISPSI